MSSTIGSYDLEYQLDHSIYTRHSGIDCLWRLYHTLKHESSKRIWLDFTELRFFDANLSALLLAILHKLQVENDHKFFADPAILRRNFEILFRNGLFGLNGVDERATTIPCRQFTKDEHIEFRDYIKNDLLEHRSLSTVPLDIKKHIKEDLLEVFNNYREYASDRYPFFVCGQYFPTSRMVAFTMIDLGPGFLPAIQKYTEGEILTDEEAICWAIEGNSIRLDEPGGIGLKRMKEYFDQERGGMQIATGSALWCSDSHIDYFPTKCRPLTSPCVGTTVNLVFRLP